MNIIKVVTNYSYNKSGFTIPFKNRHIKRFYYSIQKQAYKAVLPFHLKMGIKVDGEGNFTI